VKTIYTATTNGIFLNENTFLEQISESEKTRNRQARAKKGGRNRLKKIIKAEKKLKPKPKKKDPKNPFTNVRTHVYHYDKKEG